jgi:hypothetical protein
MGRPSAAREEAAMKYRYGVLFLLAFLATLPSSLRAQSNCSVTTFDQVTQSTSDKSGCATTLYYISYTTTWGISAYCYQTQQGLASKYNTQAITLSATGQCFTGYNPDCQPTYTWSKVTPTSYTSGGYNQLNFQALNGILQTIGSTPCTTEKGATSTYQCLQEPCQTGGGGCVVVTLGGGPYVIGHCTPLVLDLSGKGYFLTDAANGVMFDISGTGTPVQMGWTAPGANNAFLALPGPDGLVHTGQQLFGNFTPQPPCPAGDTKCSLNGFRALAVYDDPKNGGNGDGIIDARDAIFSSLRLWIDANHDGVSQPEELHTLPSLGVNAISLNYKADERTDQYGNVFRYRARVNPDIKQTDVGKTAYDVFFVVQPPATTAQSCPAPPATGKRPASSILKH